MPPLRILVADDHNLLRRGVKSLLEEHLDWKICAEAMTGREAVAKARELKPDIAILDFSMPDLNGLEAAKRIRQASPATEILILTMHYSDQLIREIVEAGIAGYLLKSDSDRDLVIAVETLARHKPFYDSHATEVILEKFNLGGRDTEAPRSVRELITAFEREIIRLLAEGKTSRQIALLLDISLKSTENHRANIMRKLELHSVTQLVRYAVRNQITEV